MSEEERFLRWWTSKWDFAAGLVALAAALTLVVGGCALVASVDSVVPLDDEIYWAPCRDTLGQPLKASDVVAAFAAEGFTMYSFEESYDCHPENFESGKAAVASLANQYGDEGAEVVVRQGYANCEVYTDGGEPPYRLDTDLDSGEEGSVFADQAYFSLANVDCTFDPPDKDAERWTGRAHAAMKNLALQLATD